jgi:ribosome-binding factor A
MRRAERYTDTLREEIGQIVGYELEDPRLTMVTVTDVRLSKDKRAARIYVTIAGDEKEHRDFISYAIAWRKKANESINCSKRLNESGRNKEKTKDSFAICLVK